MPEFKPFDLGNVLSQAEGIKGRRASNVLAQQNIDAGEALKNRAAAFNPLFQRFLQGGENAPKLNELAAVDPEKTAQIQNFLSSQQALTQKRNEAVREQEQREADLVVRGALFVKNSEFPKKALQQGFPEFVTQLEEQGVDVDALDDASVIQLADGLIQQMGAKSSLSLKELGLEQEGLQSTAGKQLEDRQRIVDEFGEGSSELTRFDAATAKGKGFSVTLPDGTVISAGGGPDVQRKTLSAAEEQVVGIDDSLARLDAIRATFDKDFLTVGGKLAAKVTSLKAKFGIGDVSPEEKQFLIKFADFTRNAIENINLSIKFLTGAQMSEKEADRIRLGSPDPGEGIFGGDDPITFKAKLDSVDRALRLARARKTILLREGINLDTLTQEGRNRQFEATTLDQVEKRINDRAKQIRKENKGISEDDMDRMLKEEFG